MKEQLQRIFDEHDAPTYAGKRDVQDALLPMVRLAAKAQQQVLEYRTLITEAALAADHDPAYSGKLELMHQTFGAVERNSTTLSAAVRELAQSMEQLDRIMSESKTDIERYDADKAAADAKAAEANAAAVDAQVKP